MKITAITTIRIENVIGQDRFDELIDAIEGLGVQLEDCGEELGNRIWGDNFYATFTQIEDEDFIIDEDNFSRIVRDFANRFNEENPSFEYEIDGMAETEIFAE